MKALFQASCVAAALTLSGQAFAEDFAALLKMDTTGAGNDHNGYDASLVSGNTDGYGQLPSSGNCANDQSTGLPDSKFASKYLHETLTLMVRTDGSKGPRIPLKMLVTSSSASTKPTIGKLMPAGHSKASTTCTYDGNTYLQIWGTYE